jgi:hypothetical protein
MNVCNKFTAFGGVFAEGKEGYGQISVGDKVFVYSEKGQLKYENAVVTSLMKDTFNAKTVKIGDGTYAQIMLDGVRNLGDIDSKDIISRERLTFEAPVKDDTLKVEKILPQAKTYNHADRKTHINMATNDLDGMAASGSLARNREWVRNVGQDLYDAHGFEAMQEVFINVKTHYPAAQLELSAIWDGVGGWAD